MKYIKRFLDWLFGSSKEEDEIITHLKIGCKNGTEYIAGARGSLHKYERKLDKSNK